MVNLELYKIFITVANEKNITRASEKLYLTQPAVSKHIKNLENILRIKLITRSNYGINLTKQGEELYNKIKDATYLLINIENKYLENREIKLGIHSTILNKIFGKCISDFYIEDPLSKIATFNHENEEMLKELQNGDLDIIFSKKIQGDLIYENLKFLKLGTWNDILIANSKSKYRDKIVNINDLTKETIYMPKKTSETTLNFFNSINCDYKKFKNIRHITYNTIIEVIHKNNAIGLVTKEFVDDEIRKNDFIILKTDFIINPIDFGIYTTNKQFDELNRFITIIKKHFNKKHRNNF